MTIEQKGGIIKIQQLTEEDRDEVEALTVLCKRYEGLDLPLHMEPARDVPGDETTQFLYYHNGSLVGFASLPPDDEIEVLGMVHPEYRRRGIGSELLSAAKQECRHRGIENLLLVCEEASQSGQAFSQAVGGTYRFSEYRMELDRAAFARFQHRPKKIALQKADTKDIDTLVVIRMASFDDTDEESRPAIVQWLNETNQRFYIGRLGDKPIGMLRLAMFENGAFINTFGVLPEHRRRGYGREILMGAIDRMVAENWEHIMIEVETDNSNALSLYHSCGFVELATYRYYRLPA